MRDYDDIAHGYAATVHKTQGVTVDYAHVLASGGMDRHLAYVALSRHREAVSLHWSTDEMGDVERLVAILSRERRSENALDYVGDDVGADVARQTASFAARRGIVPESAIVLKRQRETPNAVVNSPRPVGAKGKRPSPVITTSGGVRRRPATFSEAVSGAMERALASVWEGWSRPGSRRRRPCQVRHGGGWRRRRHSHRRRWPPHRAGFRRQDSADAAR